MKTEYHDPELNEAQGNPPTTLMEEGDWFLYDLNEQPELFDSSSMWHKCPLNASETMSTHLPVPGMWPVRYMDLAPGRTIAGLGVVGAHAPGWKCVFCYETPPEKIVTIFLLHNFDRLAK